MPLDRDSPVPAYAQIVDDITRRARSGEYPRGARLPSQTDLCEEYGVSRMTVIGAMRLLSARGLVVSRQGVGTFIRTDSSPEPPAGDVRRADVLALADDIERGIGYRIMTVDEVITTVVGLLRELAADDG